MPLPSSCLAIIPARGGSKGIPRKNVLPIYSLPLLAHSILAAKEAPEVGVILVSSDDEEIRSIATQYGAQTIVRPSTLSGDTATSESALLHALEMYAAQGNPDPEWIVFLQATSPLRFKGAISKAIKKIEEEGADSLLSVNPTHGFLWRMTPGGPTSFNYDYRKRPRRQDIPCDYIENGSFYIMRPSILRAGNRLGGKIAVFEMSDWEGFQIDTPAEFALLDTLMKTRPWEP